MAEYYNGQCRNCHNDCDGEFCSDSCRIEWEDGYGDYLYEQAKDQMLDQFESIHAHELINRTGK